jgi:hypothetical protein
MVSDLEMAAFSMVQLWPRRKMKDAIAEIGYGEE